MTAVLPTSRSAIRKLNLVGCTAWLSQWVSRGWASTTQIAGAVIAAGSIVKGPM
jgi:hypothetical protein